MPWGRKLCKACVPSGEPSCLRPALAGVRAPASRAGVRAPRRGAQERGRAGRPADARARGRAARGDERGRHDRRLVPLRGSVSARGVDAHLQRRARRQPRRVRCDQQAARHHRVGVGGRPRARRAGLVLVQDWARLPHRVGVGARQGARGAGSDCDAWRAWLAAGAPLKCRAACCRAFQCEASRFLEVKDSFRGLRWRFTQPAAHDLRLHCYT